MDDGGVFTSDAGQFAGQYVFKAKKGLSRQVVEEISKIKNEPAWMRDVEQLLHDAADDLRRRERGLFAGTLTPQEVGEHLP